MSPTSAQLHWSVYVACAAFGTSAVGLLIAADRTREPELGHWGIVSALVACVLSCVVICDRFARRITCYVHDESEKDRRQQREVTRRFAHHVTDHCNDQTREIAEEASAAILEMVNGKGPRAVR